MNFRRYAFAIMVSVAVFSLLALPSMSAAQRGGNRDGGNRDLSSLGFPKTITSPGVSPQQSGRSGFGNLSRHERQYYSDRNWGPRPGGMVYPSSFYRGYTSPSFAFQRSIYGQRYYGRGYPRSIYGYYPARIGYGLPYSIGIWPAYIGNYDVFYATYGIGWDTSFCALPIRIGFPSYWYYSSLTAGRWAPARSQYSLSDDNTQRLQQLLARQAAYKPALADSRVPAGLSIAQKTSVPVEMMAMSDQLLAEAAFREKQYPRALESVQRALQRDRENGKLWLFSGQVHLALGNYVDALQDIDAASRLIAEDEWFWVVDHFREFYRDEAYVEQIDRLSSHLESHPNDAPARALRGYHFAGLGYTEEARADLNQALSRDPENLLYHRLLQQIPPEGDPVQAAETLPPPRPEGEGESDPPLKLLGPGQDQ